MFATRTLAPAWATALGLEKRIPARELRRFDELSTSVWLDAGQTVCAEGSHGQDTVFVLEGRLDVLRDGKIIADVQPGYFAGELALITGEARNATVVAGVDSVVAVLNRREFSTMLEDCPHMTRHLMDTAIARSRS